MIWLAGLVSLVRGVAFWTGALLPLLYLPLLLVEPSAIADPWTFGKLVAVNVVALVVGHGYRGAISELSGFDR